MQVVCIDHSLTNCGVLGLLLEDCAGHFEVLIVEDSQVLVDLLLLLRLKSVVVLGSDHLVLLDQVLNPVSRGIDAQT